MSESPTDLQALRTVRDLVRWGASEFARAGLVYGHGTENALDEAFHLVLWRLNLPFDLPAVYLESNLTDGERLAVVELLRARVLTRKPAPYLTGEAWFAGLAFHVDERVLIPRSPIGEMIGDQFLPWLTRPPTTILDLCAGSGCIGIACALAFPEARVELAELDHHAIEITERNLRRHHVEDRVSIAAGDLFKPLKGRRYDLIVTNPPYVPLGEWALLAPEYKHEPRRALEAGIDGMDIVARILKDAPAHLEDAGMLICEIGGSQAEFEQRFPGFPGAWPEFANGGDGVFVITRQELKHWLDARGAAGKKGKK
ncbi:MAG: ribosomal protein N(5)-glutamine methyltransferase [Nevskia sp.]|nr:ribosomal protein N(5)-glutamine methyltransferase [Nevskia sp.]